MSLFEVDVPTKESPEVRVFVNDPDEDRMGFQFVFTHEGLVADRVLPDGEMEPLYARTWDEMGTA